jgi:hypothetical protein
MLGTMRRRRATASPCRTLPSTFHPKVNFVCSIAAAAASILNRVPILTPPLPPGDRRADGHRRRGPRLAPRSVPSPPSRTKWTRRVPHPVLIGHAASLAPYSCRTTARPRTRTCTHSTPHQRLCNTPVALQGPPLPLTARRARAGADVLALAADEAPDGSSAEVAPPPPHTPLRCRPPIPRTDRTRRIPSPVLTGHAAFPPPY